MEKVNTFLKLFFDIVRFFVKGRKKGGLVFARDRPVAQATLIPA